MAKSVQGPPYDAPPIIEAVIQFRFAESLPKARRSKMLARLVRNYPNKRELQSVGANVDFQKQEAAFVAEPQSRLSSVDETDVLVVDSDALTWSRLAPYQGWEGLADRVKKDSQIVIDTVGLRKLSRLGVRYVNRIDIPAKNEIVWYEKYLSINLTLPKMCEAVNSYGWRFEREFVDEQLLAVVQSATAVPVIPDHAAFLLDIDIVRSHDIPQKWDEVFLLIERMRKLKNEIFESSITDLARASFAR